MSDLVLKQFACGESQDDDATKTDSPFFLVFVGRLGHGGATCEVRRIRRAAWDETVTPGPQITVNPPETVAANVAGRVHVIVAVMEEDGGNDFGTAKLNALKNAMQQPWEAKALQALNADADVGLVAEFSTHITQNSQGDDLIEAKHVKVPATAADFWISFSAPGAKKGIYRVKFART